MMLGYGMRFDVSKTIASRETPPVVSAAIVAHFGMTRRQFIAASLAAAVASGRRASGQPQNRAAVVIGVDRTGTLPKLNAAAAGARSVGNWLGQEGFEVVPFVDSSGPVKAEPIFEAVSRLVDRGTLAHALGSRVELGED